MTKDEILEKFRIGGSRNPKVLYNQLKEKSIEDSKIFEIYVEDRTNVINFFVFYKVLFRNKWYETCRRFFEIKSTGEKNYGWKKL